MLISLVKCLTYLCLDAPEVGALSDSRYEIILLLLSFIKQRLIVGGSRKDTWIAIGMFHRCTLTFLVLSHFRFVSLIAD